jgi:TQXA domain-containing protein
MQMHMKLRFRVIAMCLVAVLLIGVFPSGAVYADDNDNIGEGTPGDSSQVQVMEEAPETGPDVVLTTETPETEETLTVSEQATDPETTSGDASEEDSAAELDVEPEEIDEETATEEIPETSEGEVTPQVTDPEELEIVALNEKLLDAVSNDYSLLYKLSSTKQADLETVMQAMGIAETVSVEDFQAYLADIQTQTGEINAALAEDLSLRYSLSDEDAMETFGVDQITLDLYSIRLDAVQELVTEAKDESSANFTELMYVLGRITSVTEVVPEKESISGQNTDTVAEENTALRDAVSGLLGGADESLATALIKAMATATTRRRAVAASDFTLSSVTTGDYIGFYDNPRSCDGGYSVIPLWVMPTEDYINGSAATRESDANIAYCFNYSYTQPMNRLNGSYLYYTSDGIYSITGVYCYYDKSADVDADTFTAVAQNERLTGQELYDKIISIGLNGYPHNYSGYNDGSVSDKAFRVLTQLAIWYYTDSKYINTSAMTSAEKTLFEKLINGDNLPRSVIDDNGVIDLYTSTGIAFDADTKTYQNLLSVGKVDSVVKSYSLTLEKNIEGSSTQMAQSFRFNLTLTDANGDPVTGTYGVTIKQDGTVTSTSTVTLTDGTTAATLKNGQSLTINGLPEGYHYVIQETEISTTASLAGYVTEATASSGTSQYDADSRTMTGQAQVQVEDDDPLDTTVAFTNTGLSSLSLSKTVVGDSDQTDFYFDVTLTDENGLPITGTYKVTTKTVSSSNGTDTTSSSSSTRTITDGKLSLTLQHQQTFTIEGLPMGYSYTITETAPTSSDCRTLATGSQTYDESARTASGSNVTDYETAVKYTNQYPVADGHSLTITKKMTVPDGTDPQVAAAAMDEYFTFKIYLFRYQSTSWYALTSAGVANNSFSVYSTAEDGVEVPSYTSLAFVQIQGDGLANSGSDWYDYAEVKLKAGQSITIQGLPNPTNNGSNGFCYKVVEVPSDGYSTEVTTWGWSKTSSWDKSANQATSIKYPSGWSYYYKDEEGPFAQVCNINYAENKAWVNAGVTFTNTLTDRRTLTLTKQVEDDSGYEDDKTFELEVRLFREGTTRTALSGTFPVEYQKNGVTTGTGTLNFVEKSSIARGVATVSLKSGESIVIKNLPTNMGYETMELNAEDYDTSFDYVTTAGGTGTVTGTSAYSTVDGETVPYIRVGYATGDGRLDLATTVYNSVHAFTLSKTVLGTEEEQNQNFQFRITLTTSGNDPISGTYTVVSSSTDNAIAPNYKSLTFDSNGQAVVTLSHGQSITIMGLPDGYNATAAELNVDTERYTTQVQVDGGTASNGTSATVNTSSTSTHRNSIAFTNRSKKIRLSVSKTVDGNANTNDMMQSFLFTVKLYTVGTDGSQQAISKSFLENGNITFDSTVFGVEPLTEDDVTITENGTQTVLQFYLKDGQVVNLENLPTGTYYTVIEPEPGRENGGLKQNADLSYYNSTLTYTDISGNETSQALITGYREISNHALEESNDVAFTNTRTDTLTVKKTITDNVSGNKSFTFDLTLKGKDGSPISGTYGGVTVTDGKATLTLKGGESRTLTGLPEGTTYTVEETNASQFVTTVEIIGDDGTVDNENRTASGTVYGGTVVNFTNDQEETQLIPTTGIRTDVLPFGIMAAFALGLGLVLMIRKRKAGKEM